MKKETLLSQYCRWNDSASVVGLLDRHDNIDLSYNDGVYFKFAIENNNTMILGELLTYYKQTKLQDNYNSMEYKRAYADLRKILEDALEQYVVSDDIKVVLEPYISIYDEDSERNTEHSDIANLSDLEDFDHHDPRHDRDSSEKSLELHGKDSSVHNTVFI